MYWHEDSTGSHKQAQAGIRDEASAAMGEALRIHVLTGCSRLTHAFPLAECAWT